MSAERRRGSATWARRLALVRYVLRASARQAGVALVYHRIGPLPSASAEGVVPTHPPALFVSQVRMLAAHYRLVAASDLADAAAARRRGQRFPVAITFDDDLASHAAFAAPTLGVLAIPATFFLCGASLEGPHSFWWERLERALIGGHEPHDLCAAVFPERAIQGPIDAKAIAAAIEAAGPDERRELGRRLLTQAGPDPEDAGLRAAQVREILANGFEIGFHTLRHDPLIPLGDVALAVALRDGRSGLENEAGPVTLLSYPHGRADRRVSAAAREAGYAAAFTGAGDGWSLSTDPMLMPRIEPSFRSVRELRDQITTALWRVSDA